MNDHLRLSERGARFIAGFEGCVLHPYNDPWNATIGIGHLIHFGRVTSADIERYRGFTYADAIQLLREDVRQVEEQIRSKIHVELNQNQWDALVSLVFNCGPGILESEIGADINAKQFTAAANAWQAWCHGNGGIVLNGLVRRREAERQLFLETPTTALAPYTPGDEQNWIREYDRLTHAHRAPWRRRWLRRVMTRRRKLIWHLAQKSGWNTLNRAERYRQLLLRTE